MPTLHATLALAMSAAIVAGASIAQSQSPSASGSAAGSRQMHEHMMSGMQKMQSLPMTGDMDKDFATMMRHHHMQGIEMAKMQLAHGKSPEMRRMAEKTVKEQQKDIAEFDKFLQKRK